MKKLDRSGFGHSPQPTHSKRKQELELPRGPPASTLSTVGPGPGRPCGDTTARRCHQASCVPVLRKANPTRDAIALIRGSSQSPSCPSWFYSNAPWLQRGLASQATGNTAQEGTCGAASPARRGTRRASREREKHLGSPCRSLARQPHTDANGRADPLYHGQDMPPGPGNCSNARDHGERRPSEVMAEGRHPRPSVSPGTTAGGAPRSQSVHATPPPGAAETPCARPRGQGRARRTARPPRPGRTAAQTSPSPAPFTELTCLGLRLRQLLLCGGDGFCGFTWHFWPREEKGEERGRQPRAREVHSRREGQTGKASERPGRRCWGSGPGPRPERLLVPAPPAGPRSPDPRGPARRGPPGRPPLPPARPGADGGGWKRRDSPCAERGPRWRRKESETLAEERLPGEGGLPGQGAVSRSALVLPRGALQLRLFRAAPHRALAKGAAPQGQGDPELPSAEAHLPLVPC